MLNSVRKTVVAGFIDLPIRLMGDRTSQLK
jgi:hypothetical protein